MAVKGSDRKMNANGSKQVTASQVLIPDHVGKGALRRQVQNRTLAQWACLATASIALFHQKMFHLSAGARAAALGLIFPGAGYIACSNLMGAGLAVLTVVLLPVTLLAWFGAGGIAFPILLWVLSCVGAYYSAGSSLFEYSSYIALALLVVFMGYFNNLSRNSRKAASEKRAKRNGFLSNAMAEIESIATPAPADADRELSLKDLRNIQYTIDLGLQELNDWEGYDTVDQFQTSALRYKLYEHMYCLGAYLGTYTPNLHSYVKQAFENTIEKSLTPRVLSFWRLETLWGKASLDFDPVKEDNIMVTGFLIQGIMLYIAATGDMRYAKPKSIKFRVTERNVYEYDIHTISAALVRQWKNDPFCLFPCEPNWIYTPCNFQGMTGQVVYDRVFGTKHAAAVLPRFEESLNSNFTEEDGSILPIRSQLTGFTIPGLCGALTDLVNALLCRGHLDHIATRAWAMFREECISFDNITGDLMLSGLVGADKMDPGNYTSNAHALLPHLKYVAGEFGDEKVRLAAEAKLLKEVGQITTATGATRLDMALSDATNSGNTRGSLLRNGDWRRLITEGPSSTALNGPILASVPYPGVLVAKARSHTSKDLDIVLYPSAASGEFTLGVERLAANAKYSLETGGKPQTVQTDGSGKAKFSVAVDGRTPIFLKPA